MKYIYLAIIGLLLFSSCEEKGITAEEQQKILDKKRDSIFKTIDDQWIIQIPKINQNVQNHLVNWKEWNDFEKEYRIKPVTSLSAFHKKAQRLSKLASEMQNNIPEVYNKPDVKSRIDLLNTNINSLEMLLELDLIPAKEVKELFAKINKNYQSIANQFDEILVRKAIPMEVGEQDMIQSLDTIKRATLDAIPKE
ncbi:hypothetical protein [Flavobacterium sp. I3-2]|uniref:hypothetical protein n=1 Tax=Flavobacterium sp. I3-2 TaxID=2748319 RepID=UPI0015ADB3D7|nr:hypothetical protein [Flavobacterium sp. I3-2]